MLNKKEPEVFTYEEAAAYIEEIPKFTKKHTLEHTKLFLKRLGNPAVDRKSSTLPEPMEKGLYVHTYRPYLWQRGREQGSLHPLILYL